MEIAFAGTLTESQFSQAVRHIMRPSYTRLIPIMGFLALVALLAPLLLRVIRADAPNLMSNTFPAVLFFGILCIWLIVTYQNAGKQAWRVQPLSVTLPVQGAVRESGVNVGYRGCKNCLYMGGIHAHP